MSEGKKHLSERDICTKFITPAITAAKWDLMSQIREEVSFTKGRVIVRGKLSKRGEPKRADCVLSHKPGIALAVIEAKDNTHSVGAGMQQALDYATTLDVPFAFSSIVTTSRLLNTGVDVRTCKLIVLDQRIESMTTFKQIIGRGTRILEDYGKTWFTIMDFKGATRLFADPDFDGDPVQIYEPDPDDPPTPPGGDDEDDDVIVDPEPPGRAKYHVDKVPVKIVRERTQFLGADGQFSTVAEAREKLRRELESALTR